ncbi:hypothetical protein SKAU_G00206590 [Synaphobranchus kaupii]|uniref:Uncharacterized protein n=1 Tax=Synaphobranchus kaupii TaxID=118154 RepID=A0A9Q1IYW3_SYNKA|nr:hypothetical protein SKAU_G00206590 [Synaphobranchus kaupii]
MCSCCQGHRSGRQLGPFVPGQGPWGGLDVLSSEDSLELVHVEDVFEHIHLSKEELEAGLCGSLREKDIVISHMQAELNRRFEDLENLQAGQKKQHQALHDVRVAFEKALQELEVNSSQVLKQNVTAISHLQEALQRKSEDVEEMEKLLAAANKEMVLMDLQFTEHEAKFKDQAAKGQSLTSTLEEKDRELQSLQALEKGRDLELLNANAVFEEAMQELESHTSRVLKEREEAISQLHEAMKNDTQDMEELQNLLVEAREETAHKEMLLSESEVKLGGQVAEVQNLTTTLQEKDQELQKLQSVHKRRDLEIHNVRVAFEKAVQELEANTSCVLRENEMILSQLQGALNRKAEDLEDLPNLLVGTARNELPFPQHEVLMEDPRAKGQNLITTLQEKDPKLQHKVELQGLWRYEEMLEASDHLCKEATESRKYPVTDAEKESWWGNRGSESAGLKNFDEEGETAEEGPRKTPALLHSDHDWDNCATWWQILEGKETAKAGRHQKEDLAKTLRAKIHLKVKNGHTVKYNVNTSP